MKKVTLSMKAQEKYETIKRLHEGHITKPHAAVKIGCTQRHVNRLLKRYQQEGKAAFLLGNTITFGFLLPASEISWQSSLFSLQRLPDARKNR